MWFTKKQNRACDLPALAARVREQLSAVPVNLETFDGNAERLIAVLATTPEHIAAAEAARLKIETMLRRESSVKNIQVILTAERASDGSAPSSPVSAAPRPAGPVLAEGVTHIIAVASGKGGVGKSTVAANLAIALSDLGLQVGLLDADIYGPSVPLIMGRTGDKPQMGADKKLQPIIAHGLKTMSIGFMVDPDAPMIWRGPMVQSAIIQMLRDVNWAGTDILVVDMPPGTGDAQLTFAQKLPLAGAIIVSTPQDIALIDARKGLEMFRKTNVPIIGLIENMSTFCCPNCGHVTPIFGAGGARSAAENLDVPFLGAIPLDPAIRTHTDEGTPIARAEPHHAAAILYHDIARAVRESLDAPQKPAPTIHFVD